jgi:hypothetical protein
METHYIKKSPPPAKPLNMFEFPPPTTFATALQSLQEQMASISDDFVNYYVAYMQNPGNTEYRQMYANIQSNINSINSQLFTLSNNVDSNTDAITQNLLLLDQNIQFLKYQNSNLKKRESIISEKNNSSDELISDYKQLYQESYLKNWALGLSICASFLVIYTVFQSNSKTSLVPSGLSSSSSK